MAAVRPVVVKYAAPPEDALPHAHPRIPRAHSTVAADTIPTRSTRRDDERGLAAYLTRPTCPAGRVRTTDE
ncbi:hypothetical protein IFM12276_51680 [Nocardia sputorum]|uniref:Uncharacterized protein n=1 Tax=Nocardia sputorum TaxID=2984338 RepID=A0ABN6UAH8_9NOCA|nr:hypothetical protein IFM12276_51680 [Nocardia sputorum]